MNIELVRFGIQTVYSQTVLLIHDHIFMIVIFSIFHLQDIHLHGRSRAKVLLQYSYCVKKLIFKKNIINMKEYMIVD